MDANLLGIIISGLALGFSLFAAVISARSARRERQRAIKNEISTILSRLANIGLEAVKIQFEIADKNPAYFNALSSALNQEQGFLVQQAAYLIDQVPDRVTAIEYNTVAQAIALTGDGVTADKFFQKSLKVAPDPFERARMVRSYAGYLFMYGRLDEGRANFQESINFFQSNDDASHFQRGQTFQTWAFGEAQQPNRQQEAAALVEKARNEYNAIANSLNRDTSLKTLEAVMKQVGGESTTVPGTAT